MRLLKIATLILILASCTSQTSDRRLSPGAEPASLVGDTIGLDHVLLWAQDQPAMERYLTEKLGFRLTARPGDYGGGIANKLIWFENVSFIEFLWLADPTLAAREAPREHAFVQQGNGSNAFGIQVADVDAAHAVLAAGGFNPEQPGGEAYDPDGPEGPREPMINRWRFMFLAPGSLAGNPFFVEYNLPPGPNPRSDQPNGAKALTSVWLLVDDVELTEAAYRRAGFRRAGRVALPQIGAEGVALRAGQGEIYILRASGAGSPRRRFPDRADQVIGMSIRVTNISETRPELERRLGASLDLYEGRHGRSLLAPTLESLGVYIEFHD